MKFKIGEISKMTGFSASGIRFFEDAGVITPERGKNEKYREFSMDDLQRLLICRKFRECGFSLEESVELMQNSNPQALKNHIRRQTDCLRSQLIEKEALIELFQEKIEDIENMEKTTCCEIRQMPAVYWLKLWQPGSTETELTPFSDVYDWIGRVPFTNSCMLLEPADLLTGEGELETRWGIAIDEKYVKILDIHPQEYAEYFAPCQAVRTIISPTGSLTIPADQLVEIREFVNQRNLEIIGPALSRFFYSTITDGHLVRYDHLWIPVSSE